MVKNIEFPLLCVPHIVEFDLVRDIIYRYQWSPLFIHSLPSSLSSLPGGIAW